MSTKTSDAPYMEKPVQERELQKEQMIYGGGDTLQEKQADSEKKKEQMLTE